MNNTARMFFDRARDFAAKHISKEVAKEAAKEVAKEIAMEAGKEAIKGLPDAFGGSRPRENAEKKPTPTGIQGNAEKKPTLSGIEGSSQKIDGIIAKVLREFTMPQSPVPPRISHREAELCSKIAALQNKLMAMTIAEVTGRRVRDAPTGCKWRWWIIGGIVVIIVGGSIFIWYFHRHGGANGGGGGAAARRRGSKPQGIGLLLPGSTAPDGGGRLLRRGVLLNSAAAAAGTLTVAASDPASPGSACFSSLQDGAGGKGTWGKLIDTDAEACLDRNDPNYDSGEEPYELVEAPVSTPLEVYKRSVVPIIEEYFSNGDVKLAASDLKELGYDDFHRYFVKKLVSMAMDKHDKEKEMASVLLSYLYGNVISSTQIRLGFVLLLEAVDDLAVDIPDVVDVLALFIACAVVDDILPPAFLSKAKVSLSESSKGLQVVQIAEKSYLSAPHHAELIERRWGGSTHITVEEVKKRIADLLKEYIKNGDTAEACRCIKELAVPFFHHEVVKRALTLGMESPAAEALTVKLLKEASEECMISCSQMMKGFSRFADSLDDLILDIPSAKSEFQLLVSKAISEGWLDSSYVRSGTNGSVEDDEHEKLARYKREAVSIIHEYFLSDDTAEVIRSLKELGYPEYNPIFVKKLITIAMDRKNREKEMASVLLSSLSMELFSTEDIAKGFITLLESAEDTSLDILDASDELGLFLARAVIDDVLAPLSLDEISSKLPPNCSGAETLNMARSLASACHAGERFLRCWGGGTGWAVEDAKDKITKLLEEYESGGDLGESCNCIRELGMSFFNHVVKKALVMAMEKKNERTLSLLQECFGEGIITINQMTKGFSRVRDGLDDLALDIPDAREKFLSYVEHAKKSGWLLPGFGVASVA